jgi:hypothetical protein
MLRISMNTNHRQVTYYVCVMIRCFLSIRMEMISCVARLLSFRFFFLSRFEFCWQETLQFVCTLPRFQESIV